jgi:hypothetical protein
MGQTAGGFLSSLTGGAEALGGDLMSGLGSLGSSLGGLFGGGGSGAGAAASPGASLTSGASQVAAPAAIAPAMPSSGASAASVASALPTDASGLTSPATALSGANLTDATSQFPTSMVAPVPTGVTAGGNVPLTNDTSSLGNVPLTNPTAGLATPTAGGGAGGGGFLQSLLSNPKVLQESMGAIPVLMAALNQNKLPPGAGALSTLAGQDAGIVQAQGAIAGAAQDGRLPAGAEAMLQNNLNSQISGIQQKYAQMGMSGSTAEQQDIAAAKSASMAQAFQIGNALAQQGLNEVNAASGQESTLLQQIMTAELAQSQDFQKMIADFAAAATDGGTKPAGQQTYTLQPTAA